MEPCPTIESLKAISMQTGIIYGPVRSRRLGVSLGINLLPSSYKLCSFDCLYCQYGRTYKPVTHLTYEIKDLPRAEDVAGALENFLQQAPSRSTNLDAITFSGNGEPTLHPDLKTIVEKAAILRDRYLPQAKLAILSNSSTVEKREVRETLNMFDLRIMKLDAGREDMIRELNGPSLHFYLGEVIAGLKQLKDLTLQSLFVEGRITNADPDSVELWLESVRDINPFLVQVYSLDRVPADPSINKVSIPTLQWIAGQVSCRAGVQAEVY